jgi:hypothetical protein
VFRRLFVDLLTRYRTECGLPAVAPARVARMSDDELFAAVRAARARRDAMARRESSHESSGAPSRGQTKGRKERCP